VVHGDWSEWTLWSECPASCGGSVRSRTRACDSPSPENGGLDCVGEDLITEFCGKYKGLLQWPFILWTTKDAAAYGFH